MGRTKNSPDRGTRARGERYATAAELRAKVRACAETEYEQLSGETLNTSLVGPKGADKEPTSVKVFEPITPELRTALLIDPRTDDLAREAAAHVRALRDACDFAHRVRTEIRAGGVPAPYVLTVVEVIHSVVASGAVDALWSHPDRLARPFGTAVLDPGDRARGDAALLRAVWDELRTRFAGLPPDDDAPPDPARPPPWAERPQAWRDRLAAVTALLCGYYPARANLDEFASALTVPQVIELARKAVQSARKRMPPDP